MKFLFNRFEGPLFAFLRIGAGLLFACHGAGKLFGAFGGMQQPLFSLMGLAGFIEFVAGLLIALGIFASWAALIAAAEMLVAYFKAHLPQGPWPIQNGGELALLYMLIFLGIAARGPGIWSLTRRGRRPSP